MKIEVESEELKKIARNIIDCSGEQDKIICLAGDITFMVSVAESNARESIEKENKK